MGQDILPVNLVVEQVETENSGSAFALRYSFP